MEYFGWKLVLPNNVNVATAGLSGITINDPPTDASNLALEIMRRLSGNSIQSINLLIEHLVKQLIRANIAQADLEAERQRALGLDVSWRDLCYPDSGGKARKVSKTTRPLDDFMEGA